MKGAIIGDIVGSRFEWDNNKTKNFTLFNRKCFFTDDSVLSVAVANAFVLTGKGYLPLLHNLTQELMRMGRKYPRRGYGGRFNEWLLGYNPGPYYSLGNGAPMRSSAAGFLGDSAERARELGAITAKPTHNHPDGMIAAGMVAELVWMGRHGCSMDDMRRVAESHYDIPVLDEIRPKYEFDVTSGGTMPVALAAFFESTDFEDAIRNAISVGGDSDTIAAITGAIAEGYYGVPEEIWAIAEEFLDIDMRILVENFYRYADSGEHFGADVDVGPALAKEERDYLRLSK
ncbi:MAG: ADP-ribosylglycohydrolase [Ruminococcaceae bacterium]|nr:ADP-ribosylglycohydrolase [Oscillospiraceae bacterium]